MMNPRHIVSLPEEELTRIYRLCKPEHRRVWADAGWQAIFSCNANYDAWPTPGLGYTAKHRRDYLPLEDFPHLWRIIQTVLTIEPLGGRVFVRNDQFFIKSFGAEQRIPVGVIQRPLTMPVQRAR